MTDDTWDEASIQSAFVWWHTESADYGTYIPMTEEEASRIFDGVIRKVKAEAWAEGFDAHDQDWKHHDANNWGDEDCLDVTYNPYEG